jgi:heavy metal-binding protein
MKHTWLYILLSIILFACKYPSDEKEPADNPNKCTQYACPVHPDITSTTLGNCPSCNTLMIPVDSLKKHSGKQSSR